MHASCLFIILPVLICVPSRKGVLFTEGLLSCVQVYTDLGKCMENLVSIFLACTSKIKTLFCFKRFTTVHKRSPNVRLLYTHFLEAWADFLKGLKCGNKLKSLITFKLVTFVLSMLKITNGVMIFQEAGPRSGIQHVHVSTRRNGYCNYPVPCYAT